MIIIFLVDTSASMNNSFSNGMSALECTKSGIEHLIKHLPQVKPVDKHNDKYMLVTYDDGLGCIKSTLKDPLSHLLKELKMLRANDLSNPGASLSTIFDLLNAHRVHNGLDTPATGRFPGTIEPSIILWFTDGGKQASATIQLERLNIPGITSAGVDYYHEPFRWDQRLYTIFLEPNADMVDQQLGVLSTVMGGACYRVRTLRHMLQAIDCMLGISKIPPTQYSPQAVLHIYGVVVNFEDLIVDPRRPSTVNHHQLVYVNPTWLNTPRHAGFFPLPEAFWPEADTQRLPTRNAQPTIHYHTKEEKSVDIPEGFPYDKYVVAPSPMTQELLTRPPGSCWPVYVKNSYKTEGFGFPFGFLKASTQKNAVTLTVVAYNYPALFTLLVNLNSIPGRSPTSEWLRDFEEYLSHTPSYYITPLRNAFKRMGIFNILPLEQSGVLLSQGISKTLAKNKVLAATDLERFHASDVRPSVESTVSKKKTLCANAFDVPRSELVSVLTELKKAFFKELHISSATTLASASDSPLPLALTSPKLMGAAARSPSRLESLLDSDELHSLPIADMGIYQDRMQKLQQENLRDPLRDEETSRSLQRTMFGNPYKQDKKVSIDEEDEASAADQSVSSTGSAGGTSLSSILGRRRKPRRRSISPSHFQIERIPGLTPGDRTSTGKVQVVSFGALTVDDGAPSLGIMIKDSSGKASSSDNIPDRHMVMHDGEDEDDEDDDFRRAMFNSDEMELDGDDDAARLRADTPMPGGIGLDDDDDEAGELQHAQDMIPEPLTSITMEDIQAQLDHEPSPKRRPSAVMLEDEGFKRHRESVQQDLEHLHGANSTVFESLVYDPSALMELQSIPQTFPSHSLASPQGTDLPDQRMTTAVAPRPIPKQIEQDHHQQGLVPIPYLIPPEQPEIGEPSPPPVLDDLQARTLPNDDTSDMAMQVDTDLAVAEIDLSDNIIKRRLQDDDTRMSVPSNGDASVSSWQITAPDQSLLPTISANPADASERLEHGNTADFVLVRTPQEFKVHLVKELKKTRTDYNEGYILSQIQGLDLAANWTKDQKKQAVMGCLPLATGLRRVAVVSALKALLQKTK